MNLTSYKKANPSPYFAQGQEFPIISFSQEFDCDLRTERSLMWTKILVLNLDVRVVFSTLQHSTTSISNITWNIIFKTIKTIFPSHLFCAHVDCLLNSVKVKAVKAEEFHISINQIGFSLLQIKKRQNYLTMLAVWTMRPPGPPKKRKTFTKTSLVEQKKLGRKFGNELLPDVHFG